MPDQSAQSDPPDLPHGDGNSVGAHGSGEPWWPLSPRMQILAIAAGILLFNCIVIAIVASAFLLN